jgi:hypothetical protein
MSKDKSVSGYELSTAALDRAVQLHKFEDPIDDLLVAAGKIRAWLIGNSDFETVVGPAVTAPYRYFGDEPRTGHYPAAFPTGTYWYRFDTGTRTLTYVAGEGGSRHEMNLTWDARNDVEVLKYEFALRDADLEEVPTWAR